MSYGLKQSKKQKQNKNNDEHIIKVVSISLIVGLIVMGIAYIITYMQSAKQIFFYEVSKNVGEEVEMTGFMSPIMSSDGEFFYLCKSPYQYDLTNVVGVYTESGSGKEYTTTLVTVTGKVVEATSENYDIVKVNVDGVDGYIEKDDFNSDKMQLIKDNNIKYEYVFTDNSGNTFNYKLIDSKVKDYNSDNGEESFNEINELLLMNYAGIIDTTISNIEVVLGTDGFNLDSDGIAVGNVESIATDSNAIREIRIDNTELQSLVLHLSEHSEYEDAYNISNEVLALTNEINELDLTTLNDTERKGYNTKAKEIYFRFITSLSEMQVK